MNQHIVWLDCDTGTDDAAAILCANQLPELTIVGISAVAGNVELEKTYRNALRLNRLMGTDYPVFAGADKPWRKELETGYAYHGENGLGGVELPLPENYAETTEKAWTALHAAALRYPGVLEVIATGPLTNIATALTAYPRLKKLLKRIVIMGGSAGAGNRTPAAEYNIYADPDAASVVFESGIELHMCGLDVTLQATFFEEDLLAVAAAGTRVGHLFHDSLQTPMDSQEGKGVKLHDVVAVLYTARPDMFHGRMAGVHVETRSTLCNGKTVTDLYSDKKFPTQNAFVVLEIDHPRFVKEVSELLRAYRELE